MPHYLLSCNKIWRKTSHCTNSWITLSFLCLRFKVILFFLTPCSVCWQNTRQFLILYSTISRTVLLSLWNSQHETWWHASRCQYIASWYAAQPNWCHNPPRPATPCPTPPQHPAVISNTDDIFIFTLYCLTCGTVCQGHVEYLSCIYICTKTHSFGLSTLVEPRNDGASIRQADPDISNEPDIFICKIIEVRDV